jgi:hypothetical protein
MDQAEHRRCNSSASGKAVEKWPKECYKRRLRFMKTSSFSAPWCTSVKSITTLVSLVLGYALFDFFTRHFDVSGTALLMGAGIPLGVLGLALACMVTGYSLDADGIVIRRLLWSRRIRRSEILSLTSPASVTRKGTLGLFGIWGFCGTSGLAYSGALGLHIVAASAYANRLVITRRRGWPVVISPANGEAFAQAFETAALG